MDGDTKKYCLLYLKDEKEGKNRLCFRGLVSYMKSIRIFYKYFYNFTHFIFDNLLITNNSYFIHLVVDV